VLGIRVGIAAKDRRLLRHVVVTVKGEQQTQPLGDQQGTGELSEERSRHDLFNCELVPSRFSETASSGSHILTSSLATWAHSRFTQSWARMGQPLRDLAIQNRHTAVSHRRGPSAKSSSAQMTSGQSTSRERPLSNRALKRAQRTLRHVGSTAVRDTRRSSSTGHRRAPRPGVGSQPTSPRLACTGT
jgi:hypothetical protein